MAHRCDAKIGWHPAFLRRFKDDIFAVLRTCPCITSEVEASRETLPRLLQLTSTGNLQLLLLNIFHHVGRRRKRQY